MMTEAVLQRKASVLPTAASPTSLPVTISSRIPSHSFLISISS